jgi:hypothetical protein
MSGPRVRLASRERSLMWAPSVDKVVVDDWGQAGIGTHLPYRS